VPTAQLRATLSCTPTVKTESREPILLVRGTTMTPEVNFSWNYERALNARFASGRTRASCSMTTSGLDASNHGTVTAKAACLGGCAPAVWQQRDESAFMAALNSYQETFPGISYTEIYELPPALRADAGARAQGRRALATSIRVGSRYDPSLCS
jgi:hypothetical protein